MTHHRNIVMYAQYFDFTVITFFVGGLPPTQIESRIFFCVIFVDSVADINVLITSLAQLR